MQPAKYMSWRDITLAGYGYPRVRNQGCVLIGGRRAPLVGGVAMDAFMVDTTDLPEVRLQDEVVLMGRQGADEISAHEVAATVAKRASTSSKPRNTADSSRAGTWPGRRSQPVPRPPQIANGTRAIQPGQALSTKSEIFIILNNHNMLSARHLQNRREISIYK